MTDFPASDRDELAAAYLDGDATAAERARVEADPELLARVEAMRQVAALVGEAVTPPPTEVRRAHIAAALTVSRTAENVTAIAPRRRRWDAAKVASIAAVAVAALAVPIVLFAGGDGDDDLATTAVDADASEAAGDAADDGGAGAPQVARADVADELADDDAAGDDGAEEGTMMASEPELEPPEGTFDAETEAFDLGDGGSADDGLGGFLYANALRFDLGVTADIESLEDEIVAYLTDPDAAVPPAERELDGLSCLAVWLEGEDEAVDAIAVVLAGTAVIDGEPLEYLAAEVDEGIRIVVLAVDGCDEVLDTIAS